MEVRSNTMNQSRSIKYINQDAVHMICSGQVVLSLSVAVKELLENSLDAGATNIELRFKNYGLESIEVSDNGSGISEDNFGALALKHHTSKLNDYSDLLGVTSFGFRGEALNSLCALANLTVTTRSQSSKYAMKIQYDHNGHITKQTPCSRQVGTTVTLSNLFYSLPVRQKELHKNIKREFNKMTQLLYAYCLISLGVKITCTNQTSSSNKTLVVATQGSMSYKDNIASVFGIKQLQTLMEIKPEFSRNIKENVFKGLSQEHQEEENVENIEDIEIDLSEDSNDADNNSKESETQKSKGYKNKITPIELTGFISSCAHGSGRSSTDRQFYYINSRPCEPTKVMKLINEVYKQYNSNQYPFVFLNINLDKMSVDVNVTPDKRKVFLTKEKILLDVLKYSIQKLFENVPRTLKVENFMPSSQNEVKPDIEQTRIFSSFLRQFDRQPSASNLINTTNKNENKNIELKRSNMSMLEFVSMKHKKDHELEVENKTSTEIGASEDNTSFDKTTSKEESPEFKFNPNVTDVKRESCKEKTEVVYLEYTDNLPETQIRKLDDVIIDKSHTTKSKAKIHNPIQKIYHYAENPAKKAKIITDKEDLGKCDKKTVYTKTSLDHVKALTEIYNKNKYQAAPERTKFKSTIDPVLNKKCEEELSREISKDAFKKMEIIGQFNLGFIITKLEDDLFIIDQHATDEIYNFETLQKTSELTNQKLVIPQQLELTGVNEQILQENLDIFKKNGFTFDIDPEAPPTKRVKLVTIPMSKNWIFGKEDIEELLFMLRESPSEHCRPSRVRSMFASRACRKSVMIGTALNKADMKTLVEHMAEIDKPWNCPHGRPTIRHLVNLAVVYTKRSIDSTE